MGRTCIEDSRVEPSSWPGISDHSSSSDSGSMMVNLSLRSALLVSPVTTELLLKLEPTKMVLASTSQKRISRVSPRTIVR
eukprot:228433-Hanusia_phi.AAC.3